MGSKAFHLSRLLLCSNSLLLFSGCIHTFLPFYFHVLLYWQPSLPLSRASWNELSFLCNVNPLVFPCFTSSLGKLKFQSPLSATSLLVPLSVYKQAQVSHYRLNKTLLTPSSCLQPSLLPTTTTVQVGNFSVILFPTKTLDFWPQMRRVSSSSAHLVMGNF